MSSRMPRIRQFRPTMDKLESVCLMAAGLHTAAIVHTMSVIDLKPTQVGTDAVRALLNSTPKNSRQNLFLNKLTVDTATNQVVGVATIPYKYPIVGTVNTNVAFKTNLDNPRARDVQVSLSKFNSFFKSSDKQRVQRAIIQFLTADRDQIKAAMQA